MKMSSVVEKLLKRHRIISEQIKTDELAVILHELELILRAKVPGDVAELGCYEGTSALFEQRMLQQLAPDKKLWLYDSFEGLPDKTEEDQSAAGELFQAGALKARQSELKRNFVKAGLPPPEIIKAWFYELDTADLPDRICFAFLDGDFYESIMDSLKLVWPKISTGGVVVIDDYQNAKLPGVRKAVEAFFKNEPVVIKVEKSLAIIKNEREL